MAGPVIDKSKCTNCKTCISVCPMEVFADKDDDVIVANPERCIFCRACEAQCPVNAITVKQD